MNKKEIQEKLDKREMILDAAGKVFSEKGYHSATVEEIAKQAEIGKGTIYQYFTSKQAIMAELLNNKFGKYSDSIESSVWEEDTAYHNMQRIVKAHFTELQNIYQFAMSLFQVGNSPSHCGTPVTAVLEDHKNRVTKSVEKLIQIGQQRGELCEGDITLMASAMIGAMVGISNWVIEHNGFAHSDAEKEMFINSIAKVMLAGLEGK